MERINTKTKNSSVFKQSSLANLCKITFILFECHRSIDKSIDFFFSVTMKELMIKKEFSRGNSKPCQESQIMTC